MTGRSRESIAEVEPAATMPSRGRSARLVARDRLGRSSGVRGAGRGTTPGRLGLVRTALVLACLLTGAAGVYDALDRGEAVRDMGTRSGALSAAAAELYRSLADADATAVSGFLSAGLEAPETRARYDEDIERAATILSSAGSQITRSGDAERAVTEITVHLPVYTGLVEAARANNAQGLPIGGSYLSGASRLMQSEILPAAQDLYRTETAQLGADYARARALPLVPLVLGLAGLAGLADIQVMERRRTNRALNVGLVGATVALVVISLWWVTAIMVSRGHLAEGQRHSEVATDLYDQSRIAMLQARSIEGLALVTRRGGDRDERDFGERFVTLLGALGVARDSADDTEGRRLAEAAIAAATQWREAHRLVHDFNDAGEYRGAVASVIGNDQAGLNTAFNRLDLALSEAVAHERAAFA
ncbi:MAG: hypothetical protein ACRDZO_16265, partial [Egibacteraceae bacterium]